MTQAYPHTFNRPPCTPHTFNRPPCTVPAGRADPQEFQEPLIQPLILLQALRALEYRSSVVESLLIRGLLVTGKRTLAFRLIVLLAV